MAQTTNGYFDAREVLDAARGRWVQVLGGLGVRTELLTGRHGPCPGCGGNDRFRFDDKDGEGTFLCSQGGGGLLTGNGLTLLQHCTGWEWKRCVEEIGRQWLPETARRRWHGGGAFVGGGNGNGAGDSRPPVDDLPAAPVDERPVIPLYDEGKLRAYVSGLPAITREDLKRVSPIKVEKASGAEFLEVLYGTDERVLVFTEFYSQGDFLYQVGKGACRLSQTKGVKAVRSPLPTGGREGVWFLCNPVHGKWEPQPGRRKFVFPPKGQEGPANLIEQEPEWSRRAWTNVTSFRYAVLESDVASEDLWLKALVKLPLPIVAIYSSGGKSLHALVRIDAEDKLTWDLWVRGRNQGMHGRQTSIMDLVCPLGADAAALTAVRLTRLPFCWREGTKPKGSNYKRYDAPRLQELVYLNPLRLDQAPEWKSIEMRHAGGGR
jgi:hypothetical protein